MRDISDEALAALSGDRFDDRLLVVPWYDGEPTHEGPLPVESWSIRWTRSSQIQGEAQFSVADPDGVFAPWAVDDMLGVGGTRVTCALLLGGVDEEVPLGTFRITQVEPSQVWVSASRVRSIGSDGTRHVDEPARWLASGTVSVTASDETWQVSASDFLAPQTVTHRASVMSEIELLLDDIMPVVFTSGVTDTGVPSTVAYEGSRIDALGTLVRALDAAYRVDAYGQLEVYKPGEDPVWTINPGDEGVLIDFGRTYDAGELTNTMVVEGKSGDEGVPLIGVAREASGPLSVDGPHGSIPAKRQSDILDTQGKVDAAARTYLRTAINDRAIELPVQCLPNPALEVGDVVRVETPVGGLVGPVESISLSGNRAGIDPMELGVVVPFSDMQRVGRALRLGLVS
ncbi:MAG TPA: hypothetical protein VK054_05070 [Beutenbergiaceae bacterium]|nr:hypothetical protein [Beutenbergiaceae bacterium]